MYLRHLILFLVPILGKSALTCMFVQNLFIHDYDPTIENSYKKQCEVEGRLVTIDILDTAGQEEYIAMRDQHIRRGQGFVLVFSVVQRPSYQGIDKIYAQIQRAKDDDRPPCVLVANKIGTLPLSSPCCVAIAHGPSFHFPLCRSCGGPPS
jgi:small GTP-binding protein